MQKILVDRVQVYEGLYDSDTMWVVTDYQGEEPVTVTWSTHFPSDFEFPTTEAFGRKVPAYHEMTFRAIVSEETAPFGGSGYMGMNCREAVVTEVLRCCPVINFSYDRHDPLYVGPAVTLSNRLWQAEISSRSDEFRALVGGVGELIRRVEAEAAPYAISLPLKRLLGRLAEGSVAGPPGGPEFDGLRSQALVVLHWLARSNSDLPAFAAAVESYFAVLGSGEEALGWIRSAVEAVTPSLIDALHHPDAQTRRRCALALGSGRPGNGMAVRALAAVLDDGDPGVREASAGSLGRIGPTAELATPALIEALGDEEAEVRRASLWALWQIRPAPERAVTPLIRVLERTGRNHPEEESKPSEEKDFADLLDDPERWATLMEEWESSRTEDSEREADRWFAEYELRKAAVALLGWYGPEARAAVPLLLEALKESAYGLGPVADSLARIDPEALVAALIEALRRSDGTWRMQAAEALAGLGPVAKAAIPALIVALEHEGWGAQKAAARALAEIDLDASLSALVELLRAPDLPTRRRGAQTLAEIGPKAEAARPALLEALDDDDAEVFTGAASALAAIGPGAAVVPALIRALEGRRGWARDSAACILGGLGIEAVAALPALVRVLAEGSPENRGSVLRAFSKIGPGAEAAVPAVIEALGDLDAEIRSAAANALAGIGSAAVTAVPALIPMLKDPGRSVLCNVLLALGAIGPGAAAAVPALVDALGDKRSESRVTVAYALGQIGPKAAVAVPALIESLEGDYWHLRVLSLEALGKIGAAAVAAVPRIAAHLKSRGAAERSISARALAAIGPAASEAVPALIEALGHWEPQTRRSAALAIGQVAVGDHSAIPPLIGALGDPNEEVRSAAEEALASLRGPVE